MLTFSSCTQNVQNTILDSFKDAPKMELFKVFHFLYEKEYDLNSEEAVSRYKVFKQNVKKIDETNAQNLPYQLGINKFTDLTAEEFQQLYLVAPEVRKGMLKKSIRNLREEGFFDLNADKDDEDRDELIILDGRTVAFTPVDWTSRLGLPRDQGKCGSCWTFSLTAVVEAAYAKKTGVVQPYLSTQQLVDCDLTDGGCNGGDFYNGINYIKKNGLLNDSLYPYVAVANTCVAKITFTNTKKITGFRLCSNYWGGATNACSETKVYNLLAMGPISVGIDGSVIQSYRSGIFTGTCREDNHAVTVVGYGIASGVEYFIVRNSWGINYGESGHIRIARNLANKSSCFLTNEAYIPLV